MKRRVLILPVAAVVIAGLVAWRVNRDPQPRTSPAASAAARRLAPRFELYDQHSQLVKFERYLGRTRLLLLFIASADPAEHSLVRRLVDEHAAIEDAGVQVIVVGTATPYAVREAENKLGRPFPFPVLTDVDRQSPQPVPAHREWVLIDEKSQDIAEGMFLIDRDGAVAWDQHGPQPVADPVRTIGEIADGAWPLRVE